MSDYISRADAVKAIRKCKFESVMPSGWYRGMEDAMHIVETLPSAEAVQGEWIKVEEQPYFRKHYDTVVRVYEDADSKEQRR